MFIYVLHILTVTLKHIIVKYILYHYCYIYIYIYLYSLLLFLSLVEILNQNYYTTNFKR